MKIIFLDIDGVLATIGAWDHPDYKYGRSREFYLPALTRFETFLIAHPDVALVLSSTWRKLPNWKERISKESRLIASRIIGCTETLSDNHRGREVAKYLDDMGDKVTEYAILDDSEDFLSHQKTRHVRPIGDIGIEKKHIEQLDFLLNKGRMGWRKSMILAEHAPEVLPRGWSIIDNYTDSDRVLMDIYPEYHIYFVPSEEVVTDVKCIVPVAVYCNEWGEGSFLGKDEFIRGVSLG